MIQDVFGLAWIKILHRELNGDLLCLVMKTPVLVQEPRPIVHWHLSSVRMMRRKGSEHGQTLYVADGYVTAWLMWHLQHDEEAANAFVGEKPELIHNSLYSDWRIDYPWAQ